MTTKSTTALAPKDDTTTALALLGDELSADTGQGFEDADQSAYSIPFLKLLAAMSKQCKKGTGEYLKGAEEGMYFNSVTGELFDGEVGLTIIPVHYVQKYLEFEGTVDEGGGFVRSLSAADGVALMRTTHRDDKGNDRLPRGEDGKEHILSDIREHYLLALRPGTTEVMPVVLSLASTGIKVSRDWMSQMAQFKRNPAQPGPDPMFSHVYQLTSYMKASKSVDSMYATYRITHAGKIEEMPWGAETITAIYRQAKAFKEQLALGKAQAASYDEGGPAPDSEVPF